MKIIVQGKKFEDAVKKLDIVRGDKLTFEAVKNIKIDATAGEIEMTSTDLENYLTATIEAEVIEDGSMLLPEVKTVLKAMKYLKGDYITIESMDNNNIILAGDKKKIEYTSTDVGLFPKKFDIEEENSTYTTDTKTLVNRFKKINHARSKDDTRKILQGIHFNNDEIVTIDGYVLAVNQDSNFNINNKFTIKKSTADYLIKLLDAKKDIPLQLTTDNKDIKIEFDNMVLTAQLDNQEFINYKGIMRTEDNTVIEVNKKELKDNVDFLKLNTKDNKNSLIRMQVNPENIELESKSKKGSFKVDNSIESFKGYDTFIGFNSIYMLNTLKVIEDENIIIGLGAGKTELIKVTNQDHNETYCIMPVRIQE